MRFVFVYQDGLVELLFVFADQSLYVYKKKLTEFTCLERNRVSSENVD